MDSSKKAVSKNLPVFLSSSSDSDTNQPLLRKRCQDDVQAKLDVRLSSLETLVGSIKKSLEHTPKRSRVDSSTFIMNIFSCKELAVARSTVLLWGCSLQAMY